MTVRGVCTGLFYLFLSVVVGILAPLELKEVSPQSWGWLEGKLGWDMTGFWFSPFGGNGNCRIVNSKVAFSRPGSWIIFGELSPPGRRPYPHLWVEEMGDIIDEVCPPGKPECSVRRQFALVDPVTLQVEERSPQSEKDKRDIRWGIGYLGGLKAALKGCYHPFRKGDRPEAAIPSGSKGPFTAMQPENSRYASLCLTCHYNTTIITVSK